MSTAAQLDLLAVPATSSSSEKEGLRPETTPSSPSHDELSPTANRSQRAMSITFTQNEAAERRRTYRQIISHHWECAVEAIGKHEFVATLRSLRDHEDSEKEAEIPLDEVSADDMELLEVGAVFYWTIGYETSSAGTRRRFSQIKFRRLPARTKKDLARVDEKAEELFNMFGRKPDARDTASRE